MNWDKKRILVTGGRGFLGKHLVKELKKVGATDIICPTSKECDLRKESNCKQIVRNIDIIFHLAVHGGGIGYMRKTPGDVFYDNIMMGTQLLHAAKEENIEKFVGLGTVCSYPKFAQLPFDEKAIWEGYPEETNAAYGLSKKMMIVQSQSYRQQFNFHSINLIPTNLYGPDDDFNPKTSHVIPALILKIDKAINEKSDHITLWGDGTPTRDFLYVEDAARGIILAAEHYDGETPINLGSETEISIKELANTISKLMNFTGKIKWDIEKPNGQPRRCVSNKMAEKEFGFIPKISITEGLKKTIEWYKKNVEI